jgi:hypothetical protein
MGSGRQTIEYSFWCLCEIKGRYSSGNEREGERVALALALAIDGRGRAKKEGDVPIRNRGMTRRDSHDVAVKRGKEEVLGHPLRIQKNKYLGQF